MGRRVRPYIRNQSTHFTPERHHLANQLSLDDESLAPSSAFYVLSGGWGVGYLAVQSIAPVFLNPL